jgi:hypothetical protein
VAPEQASRASKISTLGGDGVVGTVAGIVASLSPLLLFAPDEGEDEDGDDDDDDDCSSPLRM